jgi:CrcB protein
MFKQLILIFLGGGTGSVLRALVARWMAPFSFPFGTLLVNVLGCFLIGFLYALFGRQLLSDQSRLVLAVGFCGGFTTFSTFSNESLHLLRSGQGLVFAAYVGGTVLLCLLSVWLGDSVGQRVS